MYLCSHPLSWVLSLMLMSASRLMACHSGGSVLVNWFCCVRRTKGKEGLVSQGDVLVHYNSPGRGPLAPVTIQPEHLREASMS